MADSFQYKFNNIIKDRIPLNPGDIIDDFYPMPMKEEDFLYMAYTVRNFKADVAAVDAIDIFGASATSYAKMNTTSRRKASLRPNLNAKNQGVFTASASGTILIIDFTDYITINGFYYPRVQCQVGVLASNGSNQAVAGFLRITSRDGVELGSFALYSPLFVIGEGKVVIQESYDNIEFSPESGPANTLVVAKGIDFADAKVTKVYLGEVECDFELVDKTLQIKIPSNAPSNYFYFESENDGIFSNKNKYFTLT